MGERAASWLEELLEIQSFRYLERLIPVQSPVIVWRAKLRCSVWMVLKLLGSGDVSVYASLVRVRRLKGSGKIV